VQVKAPLINYSLTENVANQHVYYYFCYTQ